MIAYARAYTFGVVFVLACGCSRRHATPSGAAAYLSDEESGSLAVIDPVRAEVVERIPVGKRPRGLKVSPDGKRLYVALSGSPRAGPGTEAPEPSPADHSADAVGVVDLATHKLVGTLPAGADPESLDLSPDGHTLYVSNEESAEMTAVDLVSGQVRGTVRVGNEPEGVAVRPDGNVVFVTSEGDNDLVVIDAATLAVLAHVPTGFRPRAAVFTPDGHTAFVTNEMSASVTVVDAVAYKSVASIAVSLNSPTPMSARPMGAVLSSDGKTLYVSTGRGGSIALIDVSSRKQIGSIDGVGNRPWGIALSRDGTRLFAANGTSHDMSIVNLKTGNVDRRVHTGGLPWGIAVYEPQS
jgi:YVTN family beta-propeller protein